MILKLSFPRGEKKGLHSPDRCDSFFDFQKFPRVLLFSPVRCALQTNRQRLLSQLDCFGGENHSHFTSFPSFVLVLHRLRVLVHQSFLAGSGIQQAIINIVNGTKFDTDRSYAKVSKAFRAFAVH